MTDKIPLKYHSTDTGFCRVYYRNPENRRLYCFQNEGFGRQVNLKFYPCTADGEPICEIDRDKFAIPESLGTDQLDAELNEFLKRKE